MAAPLVFGVLNVTSDSFSDGGKFLDTARAIDHALELVAAGADVIDIGGESTRPGAERVDATLEQERVLPVIEKLIAEGVSVSLDTMRATTAQLGINLGVAYINDVSGGKADSEMFCTVAASKADYIAMHWRGHSNVMNSLSHYDNVSAEVLSELMQQVDLAQSQGIDAGRIVIDPGFGFAKESDHNWQLLRELEVFTKQPHRVLVGVSRKRFLAATVAEGSPVEARDMATHAISVYAATKNAWAVRVHDVAGTVAALKVAAELIGDQHV
jgi:dihydropteroate synthase